MGKVGERETDIRNYLFCRPYPDSIGAIFP